MLYNVLSENTPYHYAGYVYDDSTGLYYLNARYFDSKDCSVFDGGHQPWTAEWSAELDLEYYTPQELDELSDLYEWDHAHNDIEVYDSNGKHLGSMDPITGEMYKPAVKGRKIEV